MGFWGWGGDAAAGWGGPEGLQGGIRAICSSGTAFTCTTRRGGASDSQSRISEGSLFYYLRFL